MSEILARIRVRETHGIRRFLYPLRVELSLPAALWQQIPQMRLLSATGQPVPSQVSDNPVDYDQQRRYLDFALSLEPLADENYTLQISNQSAFFDDPLRIAQQPNRGILQSQQKHFSITTGDYGTFGEVVYDSVRHLRGAWNKCRMTLNGEEPGLLFNVGVYRSNYKAWLNAFDRTPLVYLDGRKALIQTDITACKSWVTITHTLEQPKPSDEIVFTLPLAITSPTLTCDFGVGGYVFGKLDASAKEIVWRTEFGDTPYAKWSVATAGRVDYVGEVDTAEAFLPQRWFHLIDSDKALAVAITKLPEGCREMTVRLTHEGDVTVAFVLSEAITGPAAFGVCYHFLNDVPAIAAATNPQSILLPPVVEVLPG